MADGTLQLTMPELIYLGQEASTSQSFRDLWTVPEESGVMSRTRAHLFPGALSDDRAHATVAKTNDAPVLWSLLESQGSRRDRRPPTGSPCSRERAIPGAASAGRARRRVSGRAVAKAPRGGVRIAERLARLEWALIAFDWRRPLLIPLSIMSMLAIGAIWLMPGQGRRRCLRVGQSTRPVSRRLRTSVRSATRPMALLMAPLSVVPFQMAYLAWARTWPRRPLVHGRPLGPHSLAVAASLPGARPR